MKNTKKPAILWGIAGLILSLCTLVAAVYGMNSEPVILADTSAAAQTAEQTLDCIRSGDYDSLEQMLYGTPDLGAFPEKSESAESQIWHAFLDSIQYQVTGESYPSGSGIAVDVHITCLDIPAVTASLQETVPGLLTRMAQETTAEIRDENNNYTEAFVAEVLSSATKQLLAGQIPMTERDITLILARSGGQWQVVPTEALQQLLCGFVAE